MTIVLECPSIWSFRIGLISSNEQEPCLSLPEPRPGLLGLPYRCVRPFFRWVLSIDRCNKIQDQIEEGMKKGEWRSGSGYVKNFDLKVRVDPADRDRIPETGPTIVTANHPMGAADAMALLALVESRRSDIKIMANEVVGRMRFIQPVCIDVDVFGEASSMNRTALRESLRHVKSGGALIVMPAGTVAHLDFKSRVVTDDPWSKHIGTSPSLKS